jgi:hypothetical protein
MNTRRLSVPVLLGSLFLATSSTSHARPPNTDDRGFRDGANHHIGDESFVTRFGRAPVPQDSEALRMNTHLAHMHDRLAAGSATRPELAPMRARVLAALGEYVAKGTTPDNLHLPWRNPVFIDDAGTICAVGYLIQQTAGRPLAEKIASTHRYDMIEDIAAAMPDVAAWVASSGLTLEEIASIQPGYIAPIVETWRPHDLTKALIPDGPVDLTTKDGRIQGDLESAQMEGAWTRLDSQQRLAGSGELRNGAGMWKSVYPDGALMAEGPFVHNVPHGKWQLFHPSGNLAAEGRFRHGYRDGAWQFFHDQPARVPIASGSFARGRVSGVWRHFDASGDLLAVSRNATPAAWRESSGGYLLDIVPGEDHVEHAIHQGNVAGDHRRLDMLRDGAERLYADLDANEVYDAAGRKLTETKGAWTESDCKWSAPRLRAAKTGDLVKLDGTFAQDRTVEACGEAEPVPPARAQHVEAMLASVRGVRSVSPEFVRKLALGDRSVKELSADEGLGDMAKVLAENMTWYIEWPHIDGRFIALFQTLPGYTPLGNDP